MSGTKRKYKELQKDLSGLCEDAVHWIFAFLDFVSHQRLALCSTSLKHASGLYNRVSAPWNKRVKLPSKIKEGDLARLCDNSGMTRFVLTYNGIVELPPFNVNRCIAEVDLSCSQVSKFDSLVNFNNLRYLCLNYTRIEGISDLGKSPLESLHVKGCRNLVDLSGINELPNLLDLNADGCKKLMNLGPVASATTLQKLSFCI